MERRSRAAVLRQAAGVAGALGGLLLAGCGSGRLSVAVATIFRHTKLRVWIPRSTRCAGDIPTALSAFRDAVASAAERVGPRITVVDVGAQDPASWFPPPPANPLLSSSAAAAFPYADDPSIPMPDLVIVPHNWLDNVLAVRALDLTPYVEAYAGAVGAPPELRRQGRAYAPGRGTIQAAVPVQRQPMVVAVDPKVPVPREASQWTTAAFGELLNRLRTAPSGTSTPLAYAPFAERDSVAYTVLPDDSGLAGALAVGYGSGLAQETAGTPLLRAVFDTGGALRGLMAGVGWSEYSGYAVSMCSSFFKLPSFRFQVFMDFLSRAAGVAETLDGSYIFPLPPTHLGKSGNGWRLLPVPAGPARPAVPTWNLDVMVSKDTAEPDIAAAVALQVLSEVPQGRLAGSTSLLSVRADVGRAQVMPYAISPGMASFIADPVHDTTTEDAWGVVQNAKQMAARERLRKSLTTALAALTRSQGGYTGCFKATPRGRGTANRVATVLNEAAAAANGGHTYAPAGVTLDQPVAE